MAGNVVQTHLRAIDTCLSERLGVLEATTERQRDVIHYLKVCLRQIAQNKAHAIEDTEPQPQPRAEDKTLDARPARHIIESKDSPPSGAEGKEVNRSNSSLEDILARARVMRQSQAQAKASSTAASSSSQSKQGSAKRGTSTSRQVFNARSALALSSTSSSPSPSAAATSSSALAATRAKEALDKHAPREARGPSGGALFSSSSSGAKDHSTPAPLHCSARPCSTALQDDVYAQLALLTSSSSTTLLRPWGQGPNACSGPTVATSPELFAAQATLLTRLRGRHGGALGSAELPPSLCFLMVERERLRAAGVQAGSAKPRPGQVRCPGGEDREDEEDNEGDAPGGPPANLLPMLQQLRQQYDKTWRARLERTSSAGLSPQERMDLLTLWYRTHTCLEVYAHLRGGAAGGEVGGDVGSDRGGSRGSECGSRKDSSGSGSGSGGVVTDPDGDYIAGLIAELLSPLPAQAPVAIPRKLAALASREWAAAARRAVEDYHAVLQARIDFVLESLCGRVVLKSVVRGLRVCADLQRDGVDCQEDWVEALKAYQAVYCLLVKHAQNYNGVLFLNK